jgi:membrane-associated PAP2 superfamily phosphatase
MEVASKQNRVASGRGQTAKRGNTGVRYSMSNAEPGAADGRSGVLAIAALLTTLLTVSALLVLFDVDRSVALRFYDAERGWPVGEEALWRWLYHYGTVPGLALTLAALAGVAVSYRSRWVRQWRRELLIIFLTAVIGGGVLVNALFKPYWGRPRPRQVTLAGGEFDYRAFYRPGTPGMGQSFPCGHCTMGFLFVSLAVFRRRAPVLAFAGTVFGLAYGSLLGVARIAQGAHFVTDVLWSFGIMSLVAAGLAYLILPDPGRLRFEESRVARRLITAGAVLAVGVIVAAFLTRRPFFETHTETVPLDDSVSKIELVVDGMLESRQVRFDEGEALRVRLQAKGFGWSTARVSFGIDRRLQGEVLTILLHAKRNGYFSEFTQQLTVNAPRRYENRLSIRSTQP